MPNTYFKYRVLEPWEYLLDILVNRRLYAAHFEDLNDPMEGTFTYTKTQVNPGFIRKLVEKQSRLRICSLSRTHNNTVMWSYYAAGHKGIVLGVEVDPGQEDVLSIEEVEYAERITFEAYHGSDPDNDAKRILSKKLSGWDHEGEIRVFTNLEFVGVRLRQLYLG
ncbi:MAG: DUF2971 domain-containing protein, partial [bacterium]|nr:DUF2971 domain-containing protein [bacterium]